MQMKNIGSTSQLTSRTDFPAIAQTTKRQTPTGGVTMPMTTFSVTITPNWTMSIWISCATLIRIGMVTIITEIG